MHSAQCTRQTTIDNTQAPYSIYPAQAPCPAGNSSKRKRLSPQTHISRAWPDFQFHMHAHSRLRHQSLTARGVRQKTKVAGARLSQRRLRREPSPLTPRRRRLNSPASRAHLATGPRGGRDGAAGGGAASGEGRPEASVTCDHWGSEAGAASWQCGGRILFQLRWPALCSDRWLDWPLSVEWRRGRPEVVWPRVARPLN